MHQHTASPTAPNISANAIPIARRAVVASLAGSGFAAMPAAGQGGQLPPAATSSRDDRLVLERGTERIALVIYPGFTALDLFGPHNMLAGLRPARMDLVAATREPVVTDTGVSVLPSATFADIAPGLDILFVPGGSLGTLAAMKNAALLAFIAQQGAASRFVTSVCTGSLVLGAAGLLRGYRATTHWAAMEALPPFGATAMADRVVIDRNRITGAGVSAGLDLGLQLVATMRDRPYAERVQLAAEYDPQPPFDAGSPAKAAPESLARLRTLYAPFAAEALRIGRASDMVPG
jgi:transcriptional regulator GlxA family with amidase domain